MCEKILNLFFPPCCIVCGKLDNRWLCNKCGFVLWKEFEAECRCDDVDDNKYFFSELMFLFKYSGIVRELILKLKFKSSPFVSKVFVNFLLKNEKLFQNIKNYDTIIPVPISKERYMERGYNQSLVFAKEIYNHFYNLEIIDECLYKVKNTVPQSSLNGNQREENVKNAYELRNKQIINNKKILLIDDIYTTGNTVNECAKTLILGKPKSIGVLTMAKD